VALPVIQEQGLDDPVYLFRTWLSRLLVLAPEPQRIEGDSTGESLMPDRDVSNFGAWFTGIVSEFPSAAIDFNAFVNQVMPDFNGMRNPLSPSGARSLSAYFELEKKSIETKFGCLSDGEKCFFICAAVVAANQAYGPLFCYWDEPDNYLSAGEVGHFVTSLRQSFGKGGQLVMTSHHPEAIRRFSDDNTIVMNRPNHLQPTTVRELSDYKLRGDLINALIRNDLSA
jgi:ABC-type sugar transport system ATPase subunit